MKTVDKDVWIKPIRNRITSDILLSQGKNYVISDVRFSAEVDFIHSLDGYVVRIIRPEVKPINGHISETALDGVEMDAIVYNDRPLDEVAQQVIEACQSAGRWSERQEALDD